MGNYYALLPAEVRYSPHLTPIAKLLYAEITCVIGRNGKTKADFGYFARALRIKQAQVKQHLNELRVDKHISNIRGDICILQPEAKEDTMQLEFDLEFINEVINKWVSLFKEALPHGLKKTDELTQAINARLVNFSKSDILAALEKRHNFVNTSEWYLKKENEVHRSKIMLLLKSDEKLQEALNHKKRFVPRLHLGIQDEQTNLDILN